MLLIHGGGWNALAKESFEFILPPFLENGHPVFNVNYRLLADAPWPACGDDCFAAAEFVFSGSLLGIETPRQLIICGASAGAHLAMATALRLPRGRVRSILSLAGPSRIDWMAENRDPLGLHDGLIERFFGSAVSIAGPEIVEASPALKVASPAPPLFCLHSRNDRLVPIRHSEEAVRAWAAVGAVAELTAFDGDGELHGFWINDAREDECLRSEVFAFVRDALRRSV